MTEQNNNPDSAVEANSNNIKPVKLILTSIAVIIILVTAGYYGFMLASTPAHLRSPELAHHHARMQVIIDGKSVDFSDEKFQQDY